MRYEVRFTEHTLTIKTEIGLFSPSGPDRGTMAMLSLASFREGEKVLDLGCGCGIVGLYAAKKCGAENVWLTDVDPRAVAMARENARLNGIVGAHFCVGNAFEGVDTSGFDRILVNPPYQSDFAVAKTFIEKGFNRLRIGGTMMMVTKRLTWYRNKLSGVFGGVRVTERDGYFVFAAERRTEHWANQKKDRSLSK